MNRVIERLVSQGATVNVRNRRGQTPLKLAMPRAAIAAATSFRGTQRR